ncbi:MAG: hypothetical protein IJ056_01195, partial [Acidaminococcaceae bacterium]|nr:hypothetical protein [Acidaminococcaceae bacterium]
AAKSGRRTGRHPEIAEGRGILKENLAVHKVLRQAKALQNRQQLLFYGLMRLWLRNSGFALRQPRHDGTFRLIK